MRFARFRIASLAVALATLVVASAARAAIITNGDFESGGTGWTLVGPFGGVVTPGGTFSLWDNGTTATPGHVFYVEVFNATSTVESLEQTVSLVGGTTYQVIYDENARVTGSGATQPQVEMFLGSTSVVAQHGVSPVDSNGSYVNSFNAITSSNFIAPSTGSYLLELRVSEVGTASDRTALFDNVAINAVAVPEPACLSIFGMGAMALLGRRRICTR